MNLKAILRWLCFAALLISPAFAAGTITATCTDKGAGVKLITWAWTGDASTGSVPAGAASCLLTTTTNLQGYRILDVEVIPGSPSPTANYSLTITDAAGVDQLNSAGSALSATTPQWLPAASNSPLKGIFTLNISGNSVASAQGTVMADLVPPTMARSGSSGGSGAAGAANPLNSSVSAATSLVISTTALKQTNTQAMLLQCWQGTGSPTTAPFSPVSATISGDVVSGGVVTSVTASFSSTPNVYCSVNSTGGAGPQGPTGAQGPAGSLNPIASDSVLGNSTGSTAAPATVLLAAPSLFQNYAVYKFPSTNAPGSIAGNEPLDIVVDSTNHNVFVCGAVAGTSAPACTAVSLASWIQLATLAGSQTFPGTDLFSGTLGIPNNGSDPGTCAVGDVEINTTSSTFKICTATNTWSPVTGGSVTFQYNSSSIGASSTLNLEGAGNGWSCTTSFPGSVATLSCSADVTLPLVQQGTPLGITTAGGSGTAYAGCGTPALLSAEITQYTVLNVRFDVTNGPSATFAPCGLGPYTLYERVGGTVVAAVAGDLLPYNLYPLTAYTGGTSSTTVTGFIFTK